MDAREMTDAELAEIEARARAATPGPWRAPDAHPHGVVIEADRGESAPGWGDGPTRRIVEGAGYLRTVDAAFIAHARTDVPALIAEVERLRAENAAICEELGADSGDWMAAIYALKDAVDAATSARCRRIAGERDAATAEVERLRTENAMLRSATDAAVDGVRAMLPAALEIARREGAEAMALRAEAACDGVARRFAELHASQWSDRRRAASGGACEGADDCAAAIRALPLDAGGES